MHTGLWISRTFKSLLIGDFCVKAGYYLDTCEREVICYVSCSRMVNGDAWAAADQPNERVNGGG